MSGDYYPGIKKSIETNDGKKFLVVKSWLSGSATSVKLIRVREGKFLYLVITDMEIIGTCETFEVMSCFRIPLNSSNDVKLIQVQEVRIDCE